jgi:hypothetical protein
VSRSLLAAGAGLLALLALAAVLAAVLPPTQADPSPTAFEEGPGNASAWMDALDQAAHPVRAVVSDLGLAEQADGEALLVLLEPEPLEEDEARILDDHLEDGGSIAVFDPGGNLNPWLSTYGVSVSDRHVLDPRGEDPTRVATNGSVDGQAFAPVIDRAPATILLDGQGDGGPWQVTRTSPADTYLDLDADGEVDRADRPGPHRIEALRPVGDGNLLVAASLHPVTNGALRDDATENAGHARALVDELVAQDAPVVSVESPHGWTPAEAPLAASVETALTLERVAPPAAAASFAVLLGLAGAAARATEPRAPYRPHTPRTDPVEPEAAGPEGEAAERLAWAVVAHEADAPPERFRKAGLEAARASADLDPPLERVLVGEAGPGDVETVVSRYRSMTNHDA